MCIMDFSCTRMFWGEGKVGVNSLYRNPCAKTRSVTTHRMSDQLVKACIKRWRRWKREFPDLGSINMGCQDIKSFFLSFWRTRKEGSAMGYICCVEYVMHIIQHRLCIVSSMKMALYNVWFREDVYLVTGRRPEFHVRTVWQTHISW